MWQDLDSAAAALLVTQQLLEKQSAQLIVPPSPDKRDKNDAMSLPRNYIFSFAEETLTQEICTVDDPAALQSLLLQCSSLESENRALRSSLRQEQSLSCQLSEEHVALKHSSKENISQMQTRLQALTR
jgi:hypothetical protein